MVYEVSKDKEGLFVLRLLVFSILFFSIAQADVIRVVGKLSGETTLKVDKQSLNITGVKSVFKNVGDVWF